MTTIAVVDSMPVNVGAHPASGMLGQVTARAGIDASGSLWRLPALRALTLASLTGFLSFSLTVASLPSWAVQNGAGLQVAGLVTSVMLVVTVAAQTAVPLLVRRFGAGRVFAAGLFALGAPAPLYVLDSSVAWLSGVSLVRGVGFAVLTVLGWTLLARLVPVGRRGEAVGVYGLALALPNLAAVPAGAALTLGGHFPVVAWLAAVPVLGVVLVPRIARSVQEPPAAPGPPTGVLAAARAAAAPSLLLAVVTLTGGGLVTFLPIERPDGALATLALLCFGLSAAFTRWRVGVLADRSGTGALLPASLLSAAVGIAVVGWGLSSAGTPGVLAGVVVFGAGYGALQNLTLVGAFARAGESGTTVASAVWNASFDTGTAIGALVVGAIAAGIGLPWTYVLLAGLLTVALPLALPLALATARPGT